MAQHLPAHVVDQILDLHLQLECALPWQRAGLQAQVDALQQAEMDRPKQRWPKRKTKRRKARQ
jgi:hypothetical protein